MLYVCSLLGIFHHFLKIENSRIVVLGAWWALSSTKQPTLVNFFTSFYSLLEDKCFTMLWWSLPYTKKNQSYKFFTTSATWEAYTHTHTHTHTYTHTHTHTLILHFELPSTHLFHPCRSSQSIMLGFLCYTAKNAEFLKGKKKKPKFRESFPMTLSLERPKNELQIHFISCFYA